MSDDRTADMNRAGSFPSAVPSGFVRSTTLRITPQRTARRSGTRTPEQEDEDRLRAERLDRDLHRWIGAAKRSLHAAPDRFEVRYTTSPGWNVFVNVVEILHRGRVVLTVPSLHGWPFEGPRGEIAGADGVSRILRAISVTDREDGSATFASDAASAAPLFGALVSTTRQDLHEAFADEDGRFWMIVEIEQEDGLPSCVLDPSDAEEAAEAVAWHPPASASTTIPLRLSCERSGCGWRIDSRRWKESAVAVRPPRMDAMEILRLASPHIG